MDSLPLRHLGNPNQCHQKTIGIVAFSYLFNKYLSPQRCRTLWRAEILRISDQIVILGNGGVKTTRTYEEDPRLYGYVLDLQKFERLLSQCIEEGSVIIEEKTLKGVEDVTFLMN